MNKQQVHFMIQRLASVLRPQAQDNLALLVGQVFTDIQPEHDNVRYLTTTDGRVVFYWERVSNNVRFPMQLALYEDPVGASDAALKDPDVERAKEEFDMVFGASYEYDTVREALLGRIEVPYPHASSLSFQTHGQWQPLLPVVTDQVQLHFRAGSTRMVIAFDTDFTM